MINKGSKFIKHDPLTINFKEIEIIKIIGYPAAGNDVFECFCDVHQKKKKVIIKIEKSKYAAFEKEIRHINILKNNDLYSKIPNIIEDGIVNNKRFIVLDKVKGNKLSTILKKIDNRSSYLTKYGYELANIHQIPSEYFSEAKQRKINDYPKESDYSNIPIEISPYINYLIEKRPVFNNQTFIHGDFHYANILWDDYDVKCVLDFEYSGQGFKEQDIAWSCILRPTQHFMDNITDIIDFIKGYLIKDYFDIESFRWCLINGYCHFYLMNLNNLEYKIKLIKLIEEVKSYNFNNI